MQIYLMKRVFSIIPVLIIVSIIVFTLIHLIPGDPARTILGQEASGEQIENLREEMGLNKSIVTQYFVWITGIFKGDLGTSYFSNQPVSEILFQYLGATLSLAIYAQILALVIAIPLGILAARKKGTIIDQILTSASLFGISLPSFLSGLFLVMIFGVLLKWLPVAGYKPLDQGIIEHIKYLTLPAVSLGLLQAALITRMTRSSMLEILGQNFIRTAKAKGAKEQRIIYYHALRNAFIPILTVIGQSFASLVAGAAVVETIFNIPGIGQLIVNSVTRRDYSVIQGIVLFITVCYVFINLFIDVLYSIIDPRVRLSSKRS
ncbi:ABC transporter permease [Pradoshia sp. D12]|uniref:ABC transporter permease n=1 Tax=Bacillaceae TaxID=186817 RepID=UPI001126C5C0|nr:MULTISPECIES: ABC transporter permease [Bacillaceae]QFK71394.1 ABC transporter permease [Pradoshia sp. D12]TPF73189.1 ABC transporter permease [Bacillus sp. D12]